MADWSSWLPYGMQGGRQVSGGGVLPLGDFVMPDGSRRTGIGLPNAMLDAYRTMRYGLGFEQDPEAPQGYVSSNAMLRGAAGAAGSAITGSLGANAMRALRGTPNQMLRRDVVSSGGAQPEMPTGITAWHGSPHDFDKFDISKIGTGEGAQAYGHGLYFAESPGVAKSYRDALSSGARGVDPPWFSALGGHPKHIGPDDAHDIAQGGIKALQSRIDRVQSEITQMESPQNRKFYGNDQMDEALSYWRNELKELNTLKERGTDTREGRLYKVTINAKPEQFLDYEKPISQQSAAIQEMVARATGNASKRSEVREVNGGWQVFVDGEPASVPYGRKIDAEKRLAAGIRTHRGDVKSDSVAEFVKHPEVVAKLREAGIPGIRYLDQGSRQGGQGTYNYVLFDDNLVKIAEKYGFVIPGPNGMPAVSEQDFEKLKRLQSESGG